MSGPNFDTPIDPWEQSRRQYDESPLNLQQRRHLYKYAAEPLIDRVAMPHPDDIESNEIDKEVLDIERVLVERLNLKGSEEIADFGCGDGTLLWYILLKKGHAGEMLGIDRNSNNFYEKRQAIVERERSGNYFANLSFIQADLELGPRVITKDRADITFINNVLYHLSYPVYVLEEAIRATKPGGRLVVGQRGPRNHARVWEFAPLIAAEINSKTSGEPLVAPHSFYLNFPSSASNAYLSRHPRVSKIDTIVQKGELWLPASAKNEYLAANFSLGDSYVPRKPDISDLIEALEAVVSSVFDDEVRRYGHFTDYVDQQVDIYEVLA